MTGEADLRATSTMPLVELPLFLMKEVSSKDLKRFIEERMPAVVKDTTASRISVKESCGTNRWFKIFHN
jgi:hypothetical protein